LCDGAIAISVILGGQSVTFVCIPGVDVALQVIEERYVGLFKRSMTVHWLSEIAMFMSLEILSPVMCVWAGRIGAWSAKSVDCMFVVCVVCVSSILYIEDNTTLHSFHRKSESKQCRGCVPRRGQGENEKG
jgi:hypothetical protein